MQRVESKLHCIIIYVQARAVVALDRGPGEPTLPLRHLMVIDFRKYLKTNIAKLLPWSLKLRRGNLGKTHIKNSAFLVVGPLRI